MTEPAPPTKPAAELGPRPRLHRSVFVKLIAIMVGTTASLLFIAFVFFGRLSSPDVIQTIQDISAETARALAKTSPDLATARRISESIHFDTRYEGPSGNWATSPDIPSIDEIQARAVAGRARGGRGRDYYVAESSDGGRYLFVWHIRRTLHEAHLRLMSIFLFLISAVILVAFAFVWRALRPLRTLHEGVARLSEGELDVVLPRRSRDEFGVVTDAFNQMARRIGEMVRTREQLLLDVSHELRSPLTRMKVALAMLPESERSQSIAADVAEMEAMTTELLELERMRNGRSVRLERRDLVPIVEEVVASFNGRPPGARVVTSGDPIELEVDGERIRMVLRNLVENAFKYSFPESRPVEILLSKTKAEAVIQVVDDGPGIPEGDLESLFEPFFRVDRSRSKKTGGFGLGLSICKRIMEAHGGTIVAERGRARGASFILTLPIRG